MKYKYILINKFKKYIFVQSIYAVGSILLYRTNIYHYNLGFSIAYFTIPIIGYFVGSYIDYKSLNNNKKELNKNGND